jgi:hypothetical protein
MYRRLNLRSSRRTADDRLQAGWHTAKGYTPSFGVALWVGRALPRTPSPWTAALWISVVAIGSLLTRVVFERAARRRLPLAAQPRVDRLERSRTIALSPSRRAHRDIEMKRRSRELNPMHPQPAVTARLQTEGDDRHAPSRARNTPEPRQVLLARTQQRCHRVARSTRVWTARVSVLITCRTYVGCAPSTYECSQGTPAERCDDPPLRLDRETTIPASSQRSADGFLALPEHSFPRYGRRNDTHRSCARLLSSPCSLEHPDIPLRRPANRVLRVAQHDVVRPDRSRWVDPVKVVAEHSAG